MKSTLIKTNNIFFNLAKLSLVVVLSLGMGSSALAKKPVPDPDPDPPPVVEGGMLYYTEGTYGVGDTIYEHNLDTGEVRGLFTQAGSYVDEQMVPSTLDHNGRWFLYVPPVDDVDYPPLPGQQFSRTRMDLVVSHESGMTIRLTNDLSFEPQSAADGPMARWVDGDSRIWVMGRRLDLATGAVIERGIYELNIDFYSGTPAVVGGPTLVPGSDLLPLSIDTGTYGVFLEAANFDVAPDNNTIYFSTWGTTTAQGLYSFDLSTGVMSTIGYDMSSPRYHAGLDALVAEGFDGSIVRINADGSGLVVVQLPEDKVTLSDAVWSPSGDNLAYEYRYYNRKKSYQQVKIMSAVDGSGVADVSLKCDGVKVFGWFPQN